jgi:UDP-glucose 4-epimerase
MAVYGNQAAPFTEQLVPQPIDPYGIAKYAVELDIKQAHEQFGLRYNIIRPHNVLGLYQNIWDRYRNVIGIFIRKAINGVPLLIYGDGEQTRAFSDIKYYMDPLDKLMNFNDSELFNIGADKYYSLNEVAHIVKEVAKTYNYDVVIEHGEARHEAKHAHCDHTKAKQYLNFTDQTNLCDLTEKMFAWAINEPNRDLKIMNYEIEKNLYSYWR